MVSVKGHILLEEQNMFHTCKCVNYAFANQIKYTCMFNGNYVDYFLSTFSFYNVTPTDLMANNPIFLFSFLFYCVSRVQFV